MKKILFLMFCLLLPATLQAESPQVVFEEDFENFLVTFIRLGLHLLRLDR